MSISLSSEVPEALTLYDTSMAAAAIHGQLTDRTNSVALKQICELVDMGDEFIVNFLVETDTSRTGGTATQAGGQLYHAALAHFQVIPATNSIGRKFQITVQVSSYIDGKYKYLIDEDNGTLRIETGASATSQGTNFAGTLAKTSTTVQTRLAMYPLVDPEHLKWFDENSEYVQVKAPIAARIAKLLNTTFEAGIPLPADQRCLRAIYEVEVLKIQAEYSEKIMMCRLSRGVFHDRTFMPRVISKKTDFSWGFSNSTDPGSSYLVEKSEFDKKVDIVRGFGKPDRIPEDAVPIRVTIAVFEMELPKKALSSSSSTGTRADESSRVEELPDEVNS